MFFNIENYPSTKKQIDYKDNPGNKYQIYKRIPLDFHYLPVRFRRQVMIKIEIETKRKFKKVLENKEHFHEMGNVSYEIAQKRFNPKEIAKYFLENI